MGDAFKIVEEWCGLEWVGGLTCDAFVICVGKKKRLVPGLVG